MQKRFPIVKEKNFGFYFAATRHYCPVKLPELIGIVGTCYILKTTKSLWKQFLTLLFAQISGKDSLREIANAIIKPTIKPTVALQAVFSPCPAIIHLPCINNFLLCTGLFCSTSAESFYYQICSSKSSNLSISAIAFLRCSSNSASRCFALFSPSFLIFKTLSTDC